jgi:hypothetical protein
MMRWAKIILGSLVALSAGLAGLLYIAFLLFWPNPLPGGPYEKEMDLSKGEAVLIPFRTTYKAEYNLIMSINYYDNKEKMEAINFFNIIKNGNIDDTTNIYLKDMPNFEIILFNKTNQISVSESNFGELYSYGSNFYDVKKYSYILDKGDYILFVKPLKKYINYKDKKINMTIKVYGK